MRKQYIEETGKHALNLKGKNASCREIIFPVNQYCYLTQIQEKFDAKKGLYAKAKRRCIQRESM